MTKQYIIKDENGSYVTTECVEQREWPAVGGAHFGVRANAAQWSSEAQARVALRALQSRFAGHHLMVVSD